MIRWENTAPRQYRAYVGTAEVGRISATAHGVILWYWGFWLSQGNTNSVTTSLEQAKDFIESAFDDWIRRANLEVKHE